jgi:hypothetical protein
MINVSTIHTIRYFTRYNGVVHVGKMAIFTGVIPLSHAFSGFSNSAVVLVAAIMILSKAISASGFIHTMVNLIGLLNSI